MPRDTSVFPNRAYMDEICEQLGVHRSTVVTWDNKGWLPADLAFHRDKGGWRYWDKDQLERAREWHNRPGKRSARRSTNAA